MVPKRKKNVPILDATVTDAHHFGILKTSRYGISFAVFILILVRPHWPLHKPLIGHTSIYKQRLNLFV